MGCVFLIIPELVRPCILGISFLQEKGCVIDVNKGIVEFKDKTGERELVVPIMHMEMVEEEEDEVIERQINDKIDSICLLYTSRCV